jgi:hypothetical protein
MQSITQRLTHVLWQWKKERITEDNQLFILIIYIWSPWKLVQSKILTAERVKDSRDQSEIQTAMRDLQDRHRSEEVQCVSCYNQM